MREGRVVSRKNLFRLVTSLVICQAAGITGSLFTAPAISDWYVQLEKPSFNPPNAVFSPVWISLFVLMGISLFLLWDKTPWDRKVKTAMTWFAVQLALNILWSALFFGLKAPLPAFIEILVLWGAILMTILWAFKVSKWAGILLLPYIFWVSFAAVLNYFLWRLNILDGLKLF